MQDKKKFLSKSHTVKVIYPPGFSDIALDETLNILNHLWVAKEFKGEVSALKNEIRIQRIYFYAITELLLRNKTLTDVRLVIFSERVIGLKAFTKACQQMPWSDYLTDNMKIKIKVDSIASQAFHENAIKEIISNVLSDYVVDEDETTSLHVEFYKDKLTMSISLAGDLLYKRGYRGILSASAPLREDIAAACIKKSLDFAKKYQDNLDPQNILIPFSGTGTFAFEYILSRFQIIPKRKFALQEMPFYKKEYLENIIQYFNKNISMNQINILCIDTDANAIKAFEENKKSFDNMLNDDGIPSVNIQSECASFFDKSFDGLKNVFIPMNPPYGIRMGSAKSSVDFYKNIANKVNEMSKTTDVMGFVLCPTENTWSIFLATLKNMKTETYHFNQGGLDIRVCQFIACPTHD